MGNDKCGLAFGKLLKSLLDLPFGDVIQGRGCFIPENDVWFPQEIAGNSYPLGLTTGLAPSVFSNIGVQTLGQIFHDLI